MKHPFDVHVGDKIRQSRCDAKLSEEELGAKLGIAGLHIQAIEEGVVRIDTELMRNLVRVLGVPAAFYFEGLATSLQSAA